MLAARGHSVTLFEQAHRVGPVGAGVLLQPSGQRVLARMGLLSELLPKVEPIHEIHAVTETGRDLVRLRYGDLQPGLMGAGLHRGDLFTLLHDRLDAARVELRLGVRVAGVRDIESRPELVDDQGGVHGPFDLVIGADGSRSLLRAAAGLCPRVIEYEYAAFWTVGDVAPVRGKLLQATRGTTQLMGLLPVGGGRCSLFWGVKVDDIARVRCRGFEALRTDILRLAPQAEPLVDRMDGFADITVATYRRVHLARPWRGRVVMIGDAAHSMSPHLGQGVNLALKDAEALADAIGSERSIPGALRHYETKRRWAIRYYAGVTAFLSPFFQGDSGLLGVGRNAVLPLMCGWGPARRIMLRTLSG